MELNELQNWIINNGLDKNNNLSWQKISRFSDNIKNIIKYHTSFLNPEINIFQRSWHILNEVYEKKTCKHCGESVKFINSKKGYRIYCSERCAVENNIELILEKKKKSGFIVNDDTYKLKRCSGCGEWKDKSSYYKNKNKIDGLQNQCKQCCVQRRKNTYWNGVSRYGRDQLREESDKHLYSPLKWKSKSKLKEHLFIYEEVRRSSDNFIECKCTYCGNWFKPTYYQIKFRVSAMNSNKYIGEGRLYCSQQCKDNCPIYNQKLYPRGYAPATSREVQPQLRQMVFARDNYTCQRCGWHKDELECGIHCHHKYPLNEDPIQSADVDTCITYCEYCHKWVHQNVAGCGYGEMRC